MGGEHGWFSFWEREGLSSLRLKTLRRSAILSGGRLRNRAVFRGYPKVLELVCSVSIRLILFSVAVKDWNRRLKICKISTAAKLLDLLADMRALVERSNLTHLFKACQEAGRAERLHGNY